MRVIEKVEASERLPEWQQTIFGKFESWLKLEDKAVEDDKEGTAIGYEQGTFQVMKSRVS